jgi:hypothetical protein
MPFPLLKPRAHPSVTAPPRHLPNTFPTSRRHTPTSQWPHTSKCSTTLPGAISNVTNSERPGGQFRMKCPTSRSPGPCSTRPPQGSQPGSRISRTALVPTKHLLSRKCHIACGSQSMCLIHDTILRPMHSQLTQSHKQCRVTRRPAFLRSHTQFPLSDPQAHPPATGPPQTSLTPSPHPPDTPLPPGTDTFRQAHTSRRAITPPAALLPHQCPT